MESPPFQTKRGTRDGCPWSIGKMYEDQAATLTASALTLLEILVSF